MTYLSKIMKPSWMFLVVLATFISCQELGLNNVDVSDLLSSSDSSYSLTSLEPDIVVQGSGNYDDYEKVIVEDLVSDDTCDDKFVSGIVEFYYEDELVYSVDFGDGTCDGLVTITYLDDNGEYITEEVSICRLFKKKGKHHHNKCFDFVYPISYTMPDSTIITITHKKDKRLIRKWYKANPGVDEKPNINFPIEIKLNDGSIVEISSQEELDAQFDSCEEGKRESCYNDGHHGEGDHDHDHDDDCDHDDDDDEDND